MSFTSPSSRFHKEHGPIGQRFHAEAYAMWAEGKVFREIGEAAGVSARQVQNWARQERWKERLEAAQKKANAKLVERQADALARMALRHRHGARIVQRLVRRLLDEGVAIVDPGNGASVDTPNGVDSEVQIARRPLLPGELLHATLAFIKAAELEYGRAGGKVSATAETKHRLPAPLEKILAERKPPNGWGERGRPTATRAVAAAQGDGPGVRLPGG